MKPPAHPGVEHKGNDLYIHCHVQPNARSNAIAGLHGRRLKIRIAAPAIDGRANEALIRFVADLFGLPKARVRLERGRRSRDKVVRVENAGQLPPELRHPR
ncbi:MAG: DUF167 family protein [Pseudomonadales bacterium]